MNDIVGRQNRFVMQSRVLRNVSIMLAVMYLIVVVVYSMDY
jgi:hypothetical protein